VSTNVISGARSVFYIGDNKVAFASNVDVSEEITYEPVDVLDNIEVQEFVPTGYRVSFTCGIFRTIKKALKFKGPGIEPSPVGAGAAEREGAHGSLRVMEIYPKSTSEILTSGILTCKIIDRLTDTVIMTLEEAKASSMNYSVTARGIVAQNLTFVAVRVRDEGSI
jgi:hypothetical protein